MSRKGENIYKRRDGRWEGRYIKQRNEGGKVSYGYVYAKTYREAKAKLASCQAAPSEISLPKATRFRDIAVQWLDVMEPQIKASSFAKYHSILESHLLPNFGNLYISEISNSKIDALCTELLQTGGKNHMGLSAKTVSDILTVLRAVLKYAIRSGQTVKCDLNSVFVKQSVRKIRVFSMKEQEILVEYLQKHPDNYSVGILMSLFTGLRIGEICGLRWEDFSHQEGVFQVQRTMQRIQLPSNSGTKTSLIITPPKSISSIRTVPLPELMQELLAIRWKSQGYFITNRNGEAIEPRVMQYHFKKILKECGIQDANFHALRHTFASRCVEVGFDVKSLSEILGHSSVAITMNRYVHPSIELKKQNMQRLSRLFAVK